MSSEKKELLPSAKSSSLVGMIFSSMWIIAWSAYSFLSGSRISITDIIFSGISVTACFSPIYFSISMDKIKDIKLGGKTE